MASLEWNFGIKIVGQHFQSAACWQEESPRSDQVIIVAKRIA